MYANLTNKEYSTIKSYEWSIKRYGYRRLDDCYTSCSVFKRRAESDIIQRMVNEHGFGYTIIGYNGFMFSCGYVVKTDDGQAFFHYFTRDRHKMIDISNLIQAWSNSPTTGYIWR